MTDEQRRNQSGPLDKDAWSSWYRSWRFIHRNKRVGLIVCSDSKLHASKLCIITVLYKNTCSLWYWPSLSIQALSGYRAARRHQVLLKMSIVNDQRKEYWCMSANQYWYSWCWFAWMHQQAILSPSFRPILYISLSNYDNQKEPVLPLSNNTATTLKFLGKVLSMQVFSLSYFLLPGSNLRSRKSIDTTKNSH